MLGECGFKIGHQCYLLLSSVEAFTAAGFIQDDHSTSALGVPLFRSPGSLQLAKDLLRRCLFWCSCNDPWRKAKQE